MEEGKTNFQGGYSPRRRRARRYDRSVPTMRNLSLHRTKRSAKNAKTPRSPRRNSMVFLGDLGVLGANSPDDRSCGSVKKCLAFHTAPTGIMPLMNVVERIKAAAEEARK